MQFGVPKGKASAKGLALVSFGGSSQSKEFVFYWDRIQTSICVYLF